MTAPAPWGRGRRPKAGRGGGDRYAALTGATGKALQGRGRGTKPPASAIPTTIHCVGRRRKKVAYMSPPRIRLSWGYRHNCPRPLGRGRSAEGRAGWGRQICCINRGYWKSLARVEAGEQTPPHQRYPPNPLHGMYRKMPKRGNIDTASPDTAFPRISP